MADPQLSFDTNIEGIIRGRGWSDRARWQLKAFERGMVFRADDPEHPELWAELDVGPGNLPAVAMYSLIQVVCGPRPQDVRPETMRFLDLAGLSHCSTCGSDMPTRPPAVWCCLRCYEAFAIRLMTSAPTVEIDALKTMKRFIRREHQ